MKMLKRGLVVAVMAVAAFALAASSASAAISPDPYRTSSASGTFKAITTLLGTSTCDLQNVEANANGTAGGASGSVTGFTIANCTNAIVSGSYTGPVSVEIDNGDVTANISSILIVNIIGGQCLYAGTLRGTMSHGGNSATVTGELTLQRTLNLFGICSNPADVELSMTFPGASVTW